MRSPILKLIYNIGRYTNNRWTRRLQKSIAETAVAFRSGWISKKMAKNGNRIRIESPCRIIGQDYISIGNNFHAGPGLRLEAYDKYMNEKFHPQITIGDNVTANFDCHIGCINNVTIGNNVLLASRIFITDHFHGSIDKKWIGIAPGSRNLVSKGAVTIEENVWIGEGVVILPGVTIGKNSIVGANAVVTSSFPENCVIAGVPARLIKKIEE